MLEHDATDFPVIATYTEHDHDGRGTAVVIRRHDDLLVSSIYSMQTGALFDAFIETLRPATEHEANALAVDRDANLKTPTYGSAFETIGMDDDLRPVWIGDETLLATWIDDAILVGVPDTLPNALTR